MSETVETEKTEEIVEKVDSEVVEQIEEKAKLETITKRTTKKRLNDRTSDSWMNLRELKKLKLRVKDKINQLKH